MRSKARPGFMTVLCLAALAITAVAALLSEAAGGRRAATEAALARADEHTRAELLALGWHVPRSAALRSMAAALRASHGVEILHVGDPFRIELPHGVVTGTAANESPLAAASVLIADELALCPPSFLRAARLRRVALCAQLAERSQPIPSLPSYRQTLLLDVEASPSFMRRLLHHEVFHFADLADDGFVLRDEAWQRLNPPGFAYGPGGRHLREAGASRLSDTLPGFVTPYATSALEEDKAEVFAFMMTRPQAMARLVARDPVLAAKVRRIEELVATLSADMDESFWARRAAAGTR